MTIKNKNHQSGFTIVELMIATTVLATLLVLCASVAVQVGRLFYKGVSSSRTQESVRNITDQVVRTLQTTSAMPVPVTQAGVQAYCIGSTRYSYVLDRQATQAQRVLWVDQNTGPCVPDLNAANGQELVPQGMRLRTFTLAPSPDQAYWNVDIAIALGADDVFNMDGTCAPSSSGGQFCDVAELNTGVYRELVQ